MTYIKNLTPGTRFILNNCGTVYVCEGVGTIGNLTRVSYSLEVDETRREYVFTKVSLTTVEVL